MTVEELLTRRLLFTVGKGGVGRTTVTLALALEAARAGKRVLAVELEGARGLERALHSLRRAGNAPPELERIDHLALDGRASLEEYLSMIIPVRRLLRTIFDSAIYQYFVAAAPGLKELMVIGKIWFEADRSSSGASDAPDIVLVDGPATGHSLQYLRMPQAAFEAFPAGLVHREAERVLGLLRDAARTSVVVVSTAEEMPANETLEIFSGIEALGLDVGLLVVNQVHAAPCTPEHLARMEARLEGQGGDQTFAEAVQRAREEAGWAAINDANLRRLSDASPATTVALPYLFCEEFGTEELVELSGLLRESGAGERP